MYVGQLVFLSKKNEKTEKYASLYGFRTFVMLFCTKNAKMHIMCNNEKKGQFNSYENKLLSIDISKVIVYSNFVLKC